jgi:hypothetical protein
MQGMQEETDAKNAGKAREIRERISSKDVL